MSCIEVTDFYFNLEKSILAKAVATGFSQVVQDKKVRNSILDAVKVANNHIGMFQDIMSSEVLPSPPTLDAEIGNSTSSPFLDKLMLFQIGFMFSSAMIYYGTGWASSPRRDLALKYALAIAGDVKAGGEWLDLMIKNRTYLQAVK